MEVAKEEIPKATEDITAPKMHTVRNPYALAKAETNGPGMHKKTISVLCLGIPLHITIPFSITK